MLLLATSTEYIFVPLDGPPGLDLTQYQVGIAVVPDAGIEPDLDDYQAATWIDGEAAFLPSSGQYPAGQYMVYARISNPPEDIRLESGRLRIGDTRT